MVPMESLEAIEKRYGENSISIPISIFPQVSGH